jgi:hypothetical protein
VAWEVTGREVLREWVATCGSEGALFAVVLRLERFFSAGPDASDDVLSAVMRAHVEGEILINYAIELGASQTVRIVAIFDLSAGS